jgi:pimeloyl-ACP methyl ester carboxylesterase
MSASETLDAWWARGSFGQVTWPRGRDRAARRYQAFLRVMGSGPWLTLLHGFPTSSWDWAPVAGLLAREHRLLAPDFLGFGRSDKPRSHAYSLSEQADLVEQLWRQWGLQRSLLVAHDYGSSVALELLDRQARGCLTVELEAVVLMNAGLYVDLYRPRLVQRLLRLPLVGPLIAAGLHERAFARSLAAVFAPAHRPSREQLHQHWRTLAHAHGPRLAPRLIRYIDERHARRAHFERVLEDPRHPLGFVWGLLDPVSGAPIADRLRARRPGAPFVAFEDVGHYPQLEVPERCAAALLHTLEAAGARA